MEPQENVPQVRFWFGKQVSPEIGKVLQKILPLEMYQHTSYAEIIDWFLERGVWIDISMEQYESLTWSWVVNYAGDAWRIAKDNGISLMYCTENMYNSFDDCMCDAVNGAIIFLEKLKSIIE